MSQHPVDSRAAHPDEQLLTQYVDGELSHEDRRHVAEHVAVCESCGHRVSVEDAARQLLRDQARAARQVHEQPAFRPRVLRLGRPSLRVMPGALAALMGSAVAAGAVTLWMVMGSAAASAVGIIGDSYCGERHRYTTGPGDEQDCTLRCVERGAAFVLITDDRRVYRLEHGEFASVAPFANARVTVTGVFNGSTVAVESIASAN